MKKEEDKIEPYYKNEAKKLTDLMFNNNFLNPELSRQSIDWLEDFIGYILQSQAESAKKVAEFTHRWEAKKNAKNY